MKNVILIILFLLGINYLQAQRLVQIKEEVQFNTNMSKGISDFSYRVLLPQTLEGRQQVIAVEYSRQPTNIWIDKDKKYAEFTIADLEEAEKITVKSLVKIYDNDLIAAKQEQKTKETKETLAYYLQSSSHFQSNHRLIKRIAARILGNTEEEIVKNIYEFVVNHMEFKTYKNQKRGAKRAYLDGKGDCTEYSELMVAICRAKGIPARIVRGLVMSNNITPEHNWVEVYLQKYSWVGFDPTKGDQWNGTTSFENMENQYIYKSFSREDKSGYSYSPMIYGASVQSTLHFEFEEIHPIRHQEVIVKHTQSNTDIFKTINYRLENGLTKLENYVLKSSLAAKKGAYEIGLENMKSAMALCRTENDSAIVLMGFANFFAIMGETRKAKVYYFKAVDKGYVSKPNLRFLKDGLQPVIESIDQIIAVSKIP